MLLCSSTKTSEHVMYTFHLILIITCILHLRTEGISGMPSKPRQQQQQILCLGTLYVQQQSHCNTGTCSTGFLLQAVWTTPTKGGQASYTSVVMLPCGSIHCSLALRALFFMMLTLQQRTMAILATSVTLFGIDMVPRSTAWLLLHPYSSTIYTYTGMYSRRVPGTYDA